ncbi:MAG: nicotinamide mononucleotide transporter [Woeseiaceae bacterium]|nr:nicotinamide mononucleotide transporter [Woeseiaceae bacterium]
MNDLLATLGRQALQFSALEVIAVIAAIAYLWLAIRQNIWCWAAAAVSTSIYIWLFIEARLYMESALNVFYLAMAAYGWYRWQSGNADDGPLRVSRWALSRHVVAIAAILAIALSNGYLMEKYSDAAFPYIDAATTWAAIWATYLVAQKVLENWWYWLVIDSASVVIYWLRDLEMTALLFVVYIVMIPFGYLSWRRSMDTG